MTRKVLLIEDDPIVLGLVQTALGSGGFQVTTCATAAEGARLFSQNPPDLVILDIGLPDGSGLDLCKTLGLGLTIDTPFMFLTARDDLQSRLAAFAAGAHDYVLKPFAVDELLARVKVQFHIKQLHDDLSRKNYDLELANRARQDVTDMIVHDLKTPLTSIMGTLGLITARGLIPEGSQSKLVESAGAAADFMLLMVNDLLDVGRAEKAGLKTELAPLELEPFFEKIRRLFAHRLERGGKTLAVRVAPGLERLTTDHILLFRILVNLIANALKISPPGGAVEVEAAREESGFLFRVLDRGPGIPDAMKKAIFEKYSTQQPKSLSEDGGTGIGLTFCRLAVQALGGRIWAEDRPGGGSVFLVRLPG
jgi:two-component system sensor histidine kinase/response regulator